MRAVGSGPEVLLVHGSATDRSTWAIQLATLSEDLRMLAATRPGADGAVVPVQQQAQILLSELDDCGVDQFVAVGSSFGAVVALDIARRWPARVRGLLMIEPPLAPSDDVPALPNGYGCRFDAIASMLGGAAAAEMFLRLVLGDRSFERMPGPLRERSMASWRHIRADSVALGRYRARYVALRSLEVPTMLVGGEKSAASYAATLDALELVLPNAQRETIANAGHMLHAEAARSFGRLLVEFVAALPVSA